MIVQVEWVVWEGGQPDQFSLFSQTGDGVKTPLFTWTATIGFTSTGWELGVRNRVDFAAHNCHLLWRVRPGADLH